MPDPHLSEPASPSGVFVYGTLRSGFAPHRALTLGLISARPAILRGYDMLHLPEGYPALFKADHDRPIYGELLTFDDLDGALARFDDYEGCRPGDPTSLYRRFVVLVDPVEEPEDPVEEPEDPVEEPEDPVGEQGNPTDPPSPVPAWCYVYAAHGRAHALSRGAIDVFDGDWVLFIGGLDG